MGDPRTLHRIAPVPAAIAGIERLTKNRTLADDTADVDGAAAAERHLARMSEASRHLPESLINDHPDIPWRAVADLGMRGKRAANPSE